MTKWNVYNSNIEESVCLLSSFIHLSRTAWFSLISLFLFFFFSHLHLYLWCTPLTLQFYPIPRSPGLEGQLCWNPMVFSLSGVIFKSKQLPTALSFPFFLIFCFLCFSGPCCQLWVHLSQLFPLPTEALFWGRWLERHNCLAVCYYFTKSWICKLVWLEGQTACMSISVPKYTCSYESKLTRMQEVVREPLIKW